MVRPPTQVLLKRGGKPPKDAARDEKIFAGRAAQAAGAHPAPTQERPTRLKILDPACGSGHFLLYCFDLLLTIY